MVLLSPFLEFFKRKKCGNSDYIDRVDLVECFLEVFGKERIKALTADREFIGKEWLAWLKVQEIEYVIRAKENGQYMSNSRGKMVKIRDLFRPLPTGSHVTLYQRRLGKKGELFDITGVRNKNGELAVLIHSPDIKDSIEIYSQRWQIETMFRAFKTAGFNCEATHITDDLRLDTLMQIMSVAFCLAYQVGEIISSDKPIITKKHGYKQKSVFRVGIDEIIRILHNIDVKLQCWIQLLMAVFQGLDKGEAKIVM